MWPPSEPLTWKNPVRFNETATSAAAAAAATLACCLRFVSHLHKPARRTVLVVFGSPLNGLINVGFDADGAEGDPSRHTTSRRSLAQRTVTILGQNPLSEVVKGPNMGEESLGPFSRRKCSILTGGILHWGQTAVLAGGLWKQNCPKVKRPNQITPNLEIIPTTKLAVFGFTRATSLIIINMSFKRC